MEMRLSSWMWMFIITCVFHSIICAERNKLKKQKKDSEEILDVSERKVSQKMQKFNKYSKLNENNAKENSDAKFKIKEKYRGKKIQMIEFPSTNYKSREISEDRKYMEKKHKRLFNTAVEEIDSNMCNELNPKRKKSKKQTNGNLKEYSKVQSSAFREKSLMNKYSPKKLEDKETRNRVSTKKPKKKRSAETNKFKGVYKTVPPNTELNENENQDESNETQLDDSKCVGSCISKIVNYDGCSENVIDNSSPIPDEEEQREQPKKVKYSKKFAHEKTSKKEKNKEAENILKLHRKAEPNEKYAKSMKRTNRFQDADDESSEEIITRKRPRTSYEDEEG